MPVLFLGPPDSPTLDLVSRLSGRVVQVTEALRSDQENLGDFDLVVSHGYRHIITPEVLSLFPGRIINLHISLLPWNRGAHPNVWALAEGTPRGVSIHQVGEGLDTGDLIAQREIAVEPGATLRSSHIQLELAASELLEQRWRSIYDGTAGQRAQHGEGSSHRASEIERLRPAMSRGWDTPVEEFIAAVR